MDTTYTCSHMLTHAHTSHTSSVSFTTDNNDMAAANYLRKNQYGYMFKKRILFPRKIEFFISVTF